MLILARKGTAAAKRHLQPQLRQLLLPMLAVHRRLKEKKRGRGERKEGEVEVEVKVEQEEEEEEAV